VGAVPIPARHTFPATGQPPQGVNFSAHFVAISPGLRFGCGNIAWQGAHKPFTHHHQQFVEDRLRA